MKTHILLCMQFEVRKNTLPYIHPYSIVDVETNEIFGQYKTQKEAELALKQGKFKSLSDKSDKDAIKCMENRINTPNGNFIAEKKKLKKARRIKLN